MPNGVRAVIFTSVLLNVLTLHGHDYKHIKPLLTLSKDFLMGLPIYEKPWVLPTSWTSRVRTDLLRLVPPERSCLGSFLSFVYFEDSSLREGIRGPWPACG